MASSGTYNFNPSLGGMGLYALRRCGIKRTEVTTDHLTDMQMAANMVLSDLSNDTPNFWTVTLQSIALVAGNPGPYTLAANTVLVLDCYITTTVNGISTDRIIYPVGRTEYASYPNKSMQQAPTVYWFDRVLPPTLTVYPAPDANATYTLNYYVCAQDQDAVLAGSTGLDIPYRFLKAFTDLLTAELATIYASDKAVGFAALVAASLKKAQETDREVVPMYITPGLGGYYR